MFVHKVCYVPFNMQFFAFQVLFTVFGTYFLTNGAEIDQRDCKVQGQQISLGNGWFECRRGKFVPVACITFSGARVDIEQSYVQGDQLVKCKQTSPTSITWEVAGCFTDGQMLYVGQTGHDDKYWFTCALDGKATRVQNQGCLGKDGTIVAPGQNFTKQITVFSCVKADEKRPKGQEIVVEPVGCDWNGKVYEINQDVLTQDGFWYTCKKYDDPNRVGTYLDMVGCLQDGKKINAGETIDVDGFRSTCRVKPILNDADLEEVKSGMSCLEYKAGSKIQHQVGSSWTEGGRDGDLIKYSVQCTQENLKISTHVWKCVYDGPEGKFEIENGCYKKFGGTLFQCSIDKWRDGRAQITSHATDETEKKTQDSGFKNC